MSEENKDLTTDDVRMTLTEAMDLKKKLLTSFDNHACKARRGYADSADALARTAQTLINLDEHVAKMRLIK